MKKQKFKTVIFGATFYGISRLIGNSKDCMLIERTSLTGSEFVDSLNEKGGKRIEPCTEFGKTFKEALTEKHFINDKGEIYSAPALFLLCDLLKKAAADILFCTEITQIKKVSGSYEITFFNCNGFSTILADEIIDTTSSGVLHDTIRQAAVQKSLNVIIQKPDTFNNILLEPLVKNSLTGIQVFRFPVLLEDDYAAARKKLYTFWRQHQEALGSCRMVFTANTFAYHMPNTWKTVDSNFFWIPSCGFDNLLHAVDQGQNTSEPILNGPDQS